MSLPSFTHFLIYNELCVQKYWVITLNLEYEALNLILFVLSSFPEFYDAGNFYIMKLRRVYQLNTKDRRTERLTHWLKDCHPWGAHTMLKFNLIGPLIQINAHNLSPVLLKKFQASMEIHYRIDCVDWLQ